MVNRSILYTMAILIASAATTLAGPVTLADLDTDFSLTQGTAGWTYGVYTTPFTPSTFSTSNITSTWHYILTAGETNFQIFNDGSTTYFAPQAGDSPTADATTVTIPVARWTDSGYTGSVTISGFYYKVEGTTGSYIPTVAPTVYIGDTQVYSANLVPGTTSSTPYSFTTNVTAGQTIDFVLGLPIVPAPGGGSPAYYDYNAYTAFDGTVTTASVATPEPASWSLFLIGSGFCIAGIRRSKARR